MLVVSHPSQSEPLLSAGEFPKRRASAPHQPLGARIPSIVIRRAKSLSDLFASQFGGEWDTVVRQESWRVVPAVDDPNALPLAPASIEIAPFLSEQGRDHLPRLVALSGERRLAIIPVPNELGCDCAVVGFVNCRTEELWSRLTAALVETCESQRLREEAERQLDDFTQQVTTDFEELAWLRSLTEYIELCDLDHTVAQVAANILPSLRELIGAEAIAIVPVASATDGTADSKPIYTTGEWRLDPADWQSVAEQFGEQALVGPVVRNSSFTGFCTVNTRLEPRSFVLTHIGRGEEQTGWLLAINKLPPAQGVALDARSCQADEFGTNEAGMVVAAAVLLGNHAHNLAMFRRQEELFRGVVKALVDTIEAKDSYTRGHSDRVARMARRLAERLMYTRTESEQLYMAGLLHDIGKIGVPDEVLLKPGKLTDEEFALIKKHPEIGYSILKHLDPLSYVFPGVLHHHESVDGSGYPHGLAGDQIPHCARILAVVDAYDAMTSNRPYRNGMSTTQAESILNKGAGQQWDENVVAAFMEIRDAIYQICHIDPTADRPSAAPPKDSPLAPTAPAPIQPSAASDALIQPAAAP